MRICMIGWADYPHIQRQATWLARRGHEVHVLSNQLACIPGVEVHNVWPEPDLRPRWRRFIELSFHTHLNSMLRILERMRRLIHEIRPDVLHSHSWNFPGNLGILLGFQPQILTVWNYNDLSYPVESLFRWVNQAPVESHYRQRPWWQREAARVLMRRASVVTAFTPEMLRELRQIGLRKERTVLHNWGVELDRFHPATDRARVRRELGLPEHAPIILSTRNVSRLNNTRSIIDAAGLVTAQVPEALFVFIWNYAEPKYMTGEVLAAAQTGRLDRSIRWVGRVGYEDIQRYYQAADLFVSVPTWDQGPCSLLEAMACGVVPVLSDLPFAKDWTPGESPLVPPGDPRALSREIVGLLQDKPRQERIREAQLRWVEGWADHDQNMEKIERLYYRLSGISVPGRMPALS